MWAPGHQCLSSCLNILAPACAWLRWRLRWHPPPRQGEIEGPVMVRQRVRCNYNYGISWISYKSKLCHDIGDLLIFTSKEYSALSWTRSRGPLVFKGGYDACTWTYKMDPKKYFHRLKTYPKQVFLSVFATLNMQVMHQAVRYNLLVIFF